MDFANVYPLLLLLFVMPGFFFLKGYGYKSESGHDYLMMSIFWGFLLLAFIYAIFPDTILEGNNESIFASIMAYSVIGWPFGKTAKYATDTMKPAWLEIKTRLTHQLEKIPTSVAIVLVLAVQGCVLLLISSQY